MLQRIAIAFFAMALSVSLGGGLLAGHPPAIAVVMAVASGMVFAVLGVLVGMFFSKLF